MDLISWHVLRFLEFRNIDRSCDNLLIVLGFLQRIAFGRVNCFAVVITAKGSVYGCEKSLNKLTTALNNPVPFTPILRFRILVFVMKEKLITLRNILTNVLGPLSVTTQLNQLSGNSISELLSTFTIE